MNSEQLQSALSMNADQRSDFLLKQVQDNQQIWTIVDEEGVMLLISDDEDCIPVWPAESCVNEWINNDWAHCTAHAISLSDWKEKWLPGLEEDEVSIAMFPLSHDGGLVVSPWDWQSN
ncbi:DUF2750 domain-containing protein [Alteromonadaceae bacterium BrNp21-10]|nr:DUF2750 domain-containing protein [Alteromonadaceae bacterium BrNp21-10]